MRKKESLRVFLIEQKKMQSEQELCKSFHQNLTEHKARTVLLLNFGRTWLHSRFYQYLLLEANEDDYEFIESIPTLLSKQTVLKKYLEEAGFSKIAENKRDEVEQHFEYIWGLLATEISLPMLKSELIKLHIQLKLDFKKSKQLSFDSLMKEEESTQPNFENLFSKHLALEDRKEDRHPSEDLLHSLLKIEENEKVLLQEVVQLTEKTLPKYTTTTQAPYISKVQIIVKDMKYTYEGREAARTKKESEKLAARSALKNIAEDAELQVLAKRYKAHKLK